jgi:hypothetical protein
MGLPVELQTLICRAAVAGTVMAGQLPPGPLDGGVPPPGQGLGGGALEAPSIPLYMYLCIYIGLRAHFV